jgi:hypothetical protein
MKPLPTRDGAPEGRWRSWVAPLAILLLILSTFAWVPPTNFGGFDEWFIVDVSAQGIIDFPYANRPLVFIWVLPAAFLFPGTLYGYWVVHVAYLFGSAMTLMALGRRLVPQSEMLPIVAAGVLATWAPTDPQRVNVINNLFYSGVAFGTLLSIAIFHEAWLRRSPPLVVLASLLGVTAARSYEAVLALLLLGPPLLLLHAEGRLTRDHWRWLLPWEVAMGVAASLVALPLLQPETIGSYQLSGLGMDLHAGRLVQRLVYQVQAHLSPLLSIPLERSFVPGLALALASTAAIFGTMAPRRASGPPETVRTLGRLALFGLALAYLGLSVLILSRAIRGPDRVQGFTGPGVALFLASVVCMPAAVWPVGGRRLTALLSAWIFVAGTAHSLALQRWWDQRNAYPAQSRVLCQLTRNVPAVRPNTLILLIDDLGSFPAVFTFRHAVRYFYGRSAIGYVSGAHELFYPLTFEADAVRYEPWLRIREPWNVPATRHSYEEIVLVYASQGGTLSVLNEWPDRLPKASGTKRYDPHRRILPSPAGTNGHRAILETCKDLP